MKYTPLVSTLDDEDDTGSEEYKSTDQDIHLSEVDEQILLENLIEAQHTTENFDDDDGLDNPRPKRIRKPPTYLDEFQIGE